MQNVTNLHKKTKQDFVKTVLSQSKENMDSVAAAIGLDVQISIDEMIEPLCECIKMSSEELWSCYNFMKSERFKQYSKEVEVMGEVFSTLVAEQIMGSEGKTKH